MYASTSMHLRVHIYYLHVFFLFNLTRTNSTNYKQSVVLLKPYDINKLQVPKKLPQSRLDTYMTYSWL